MATVKQLFDALRSIVEPGQAQDIVTAGRVHDAKIEGGTVRFAVSLSQARPETMKAIRSACEQAVGALEGVESVEVSLRVPRESAGREGSGTGLEKVARVIAVSSCKGGVGKSTVAAHLARALQRAGHKTGLLDADVYGPSTPSLFNVSQPAIRSNGNMFYPVAIDGLQVMSMGFLMGDQPAVLRGPIVSNYIMQVLKQCDWGKLDYLIIDLPPGTGDIQLTLVQQASLDGAIIVTTPHQLSLVDVAKGILMFEKVKVPVLGVVENMSSFTCGTCHEVHYPFGRGQGLLQRRFGIRTLAELPIIPGMAGAERRTSGADLEAFATLAQATVAAVQETEDAGAGAPEIDFLPGAVRVQFNDGFTASIANHALRCACPCAMCVDETSGERILQPEQVPQNITPEAVTPLGNYAVAFQWSDGHSTGIYSWDYLRTIAEGKGAFANA